MKRTVAIIAFAAAAWFGTAPASADWPLFGHDPARSGVAGPDAGLSAANVGRLHRRWAIALDAAADGAPIELDRAGGAGAAGARALLFVETTRGTTYAVDARSGAIVWKRTTSGPRITNSMPAADPSGRWIYAPGVDGFVRKYDALTGVEQIGGGFPLRVTWSPDIEKDGASLNVANGFLYAATGGYYGDFGQYDGHVVALDLATGRVRVINSLCSQIHHLIQTPGECADAKSGIWARAGVVVDPDPSMGGRVYAATGNGKYDANAGGADYGDSVLAISADGSAILDSYTPSDYQQLEDGDTDLGSTAPALLPRQTGSKTPLLAVQGGKDQQLKLLDRRHLGGVGDELQEYDLGDELFSAPAVWTDPHGATLVFIGTASAVSAFAVETVDGKSALRRVWSAASGGTSPIVAGGLVFAATDDAVNAFDAMSGKLVWSTAQPSAGGSIGSVHWESPIVDRGWLYVSDETGRLYGYGP
jgi:outer membrane protein assembly factor BamB